MTECPKCGSTEIVKDLLLFTGDEGEFVNVVFASMEDPTGRVQDVHVGFRVDVCGSCGHSEMHTRWHADLLAASKKGLISAERG